MNQNNENFGVDVARNTTNVTGEPFLHEPRNIETKIDNKLDRADGHITSKTTNDSGNAVNNIVKIIQT